MSEEALRILFHMLGLCPSQHRLNQYRNHYVAGPGHHTNELLIELVAHGLVEQRRRPGFLAESDVVYAATDLGRGLAQWEAEKRVPKLTRAQRRYRRWLSSEHSLTFGEWLKAGAT